MWGFLVMTHPPDPVNPCLFFHVQPISRAFGNSTPPDPLRHIDLPEISHSCCCIVTQNMAFKARQAHAFVTAKRASLKDRSAIASREDRSRRYRRVHFYRIVH